MRVHHLDCLSMCPFGGSLVGDEGGITTRTRLVAHCLLVERKNGLLLVDTGAGLQDADDPYARYGRAFVWSANAQITRERCAIEQIRALGFDPADVRDIVLTHLDLDHAGGLVDFPNANVHVTHAEKTAALAPKTAIEHVRYVQKMWSHGPKWAPHTPTGDTWNGFEAVRAIDDDPDVLIVPLEGHTRGHAAIAVHSSVPNGREWLLHAGDSYFAQGEIHSTPPTCPPVLSIYESILALDDDARKRNQLRLRALAAETSAKVDVFCAHSPTEFDRLKNIEASLA
ncbi:MAG TPA: MBL fold metallo-hydrolase [Polyangiaceae bacterium]